MLKRKPDYEVQIESKFKKLTINHQIKNQYMCDVHSNSPEICRIYDCCGFLKNNVENLIKYYIK